MKIFVIGTWRPEVAESHAAEGAELGKLLAERGHVLIASPSSGLQGHVAKSYKAHGGSHYIGYYPANHHIEAYDEKFMVEPDEKVMTEDDYTFRSLLEVRLADGVIAVTGATGTPMEFIYAVTDLQIPVAYLKGSSRNMDLLMQFDGIKGKKNVFEGDKILSLIEFVEKYQK